MEPMFENRYKTTHQMLAEFGRKHAVGPRIQTVIPCLIMLGYFVFYCLQRGILEDVLPTLLGVGAVYFVLFFMPHFYAWSGLKRARQNNDGILPETVITFGDDIQLFEGGVHLTIEYRKIVRVVRLKHSYILMTTRRTGVMLDPNGFTKGTFSEFKQFLRQKRPDLEIPE